VHRCCPRAARGHNRQAGRPACWPHPDTRPPADRSPLTGGAWLRVRPAIFCFRPSHGQRANCDLPATDRTDLSSPAGLQLCLSECTWESTDKSELPRRRPDNGADRRRAPAPRAAGSGRAQRAGAARRPGRHRQPAHFTPGSCSVGRARAGVASGDRTSPKAMQGAPARRLQVLPRAAMSPPPPLLRLPRGPLLRRPRRDQHGLSVSRGARGLSFDQRSTAQHS
jgi:hypothetical protein